MPVRGDEGRQGGSQPGCLTNKENENARPRVLTADELRDIWTVLPEGDYGTIVRLLILTGQRRTEIGDLRWSEIDMKRSTITLPPGRVKNDRLHVIPMSEPVKDLLKGIKQTPERDFVFGYGNTGLPAGRNVRSGSMPRSMPIARSQWRSGRSTTAGAPVQR